MKVLHLFNEINFSGAELMYANATPIFQKNKIELLAFSTGKNLGDFASAFEEKKIKTYHKPIPSGIHFSLKTVQYYLDFYNFLKTGKIDVLHIHRSNLYLVAVCSRIAGVRTVKTMHNVFKNRKHTYPYGVFKRWFARKFLNVTFQTIGKSVYENELNYYHNPSVQINNWYDSNRFFPSKNNLEKQVLRKKFNITPNEFVVISVGGCSEIKNHSDIIRALATIDKKLNWKYLHLGSGITEEKEKKLAVELGVQNSISFLGNRHNVRDYLIASDVFVMTSKHEGLSIASLEAMACGLPSILYNSPGLRDLITNDDNGFLIEPDYKLIAEKIITYKDNPILANKKGESACHFVNQHFFMKKNVEKIISLYKTNK